MGVPFWADPRTLMDCLSGAEIWIAKNLRSDPEVFGYNN